MNKKIKNMNKSVQQIYISPDQQLSISAETFKKQKTACEKFFNQITDKHLSVMDQFLDSQKQKYKIPNPQKISIYEDVYYIYKYKIWTQLQENKPTRQQVIQALSDQFSRSQVTVDERIKKKYHTVGLQTIMKSIQNNTPLILAKKSKQAANLKKPVKNLDSTPSINKMENQIILNLKKTPEQKIQNKSILKHIIFNYDFTTSKFICFQQKNNIVKDQSQHKQLSSIKQSKARGQVTHENSSKKQIYEKTASSKKSSNIFKGKYFNTNPQNQNVIRSTFNTLMHSVSYNLAIFQRITKNPEQYQKYKWYPQEDLTLKSFVINPEYYMQELIVILKHKDIQRVKERIKYLNLPTNQSIDKYLDEIYLKKYKKQSKQPEYIQNTQNMQNMQIEQEVKQIQ